MRILDYFIPDQLVCKYAHEINGLGFTRIEAHRAIYRYLVKHYDVFKKYFKSEKDFILFYVPKIDDYFGKKCKKDFLHNPKGKHYRGCTNEEAYQVYMFAYALDKTIEQLVDHPTPIQRHIMNLSQVR